MSTTTDEKDRLGETLHRKEKAEEGRFFAERDAAAIARLREKARPAAPAEDRKHTTPETCPRCGEPLITARCPAGHR